MLLLRLELPDRPGSLGAVATAMGAVQADILMMEIVERDQNSAVNDFLIELPPTTMPDTLVSACRDVEGVRVLWLSRYLDAGGLESDIELLERMTAEPDEAPAVLTDAAPRVFHAQWAAVLSAEGKALHATELAPDFDADTLAAIGSLRETHAVELPRDWTPGWAETIVAVTPMGMASGFVVGRQGGPAFLPSELRRLQHLAALAL